MQSALEAYQRGDLMEAERVYRRLLETDDRNGLAHNNLANLLRKSGRFSEAEAHYDRALAWLPDSAEIRNNRAGTLEQLQRYEHAEIEYRHALELKPDFAEARFNLGLLLLAAGRYTEGWTYYEARSKAFGEHQRLPFPQRNVEDLSGKTLLLLPEQGYGDSIQFVRYVPLLKARGAAKISVICDPLLAPPLRTVEGIDALVTDPQAPHAHDYYTLMSLPLRLGTTVESIPATIPYVGVFANRLERWKARLPSHGLRIGLVWKGNPGHENDARRSSRHFSDLAPLWSVSGIRFISLQVGGAETEADECTALQPLFRFGREIRDFADTAAIIAQLNLVICVGTAVAHVAGVLGVACWLMLPQTGGGDWRWHRTGSRSPRYPNDMYLFRQREAGWPALIGDVRDALADITQGAR